MNNEKSRAPMKMGPLSGGHRNNISKAENFKGSMKKLLLYLNEYKLSLFSVLILAAGSTVFSIIGPKILGNATTEIFNGLIKKLSGKGGIDFSKIKKILLLLLILYIISALFSFAQGFLSSGISQKFTYKLRKECSEKIHKLPMNYFDTHTNGEILSVITNDIDTLNQSLNQSLTQVITSFTTLIGIIIMMFSINVYMSIAVLLIIPISLILTAFIVKKSQKYFKEQQKYLGHVNGKIEESYGGQNIIKLFNSEKIYIKEFEKDNTILYNSAWKSQFLSGLMQPIIAFIGNLSYVVTSILGGYFAIKGSITVGDIQSFIQYSRNFTQPISQLAQVSNLIQSVAACSERIFNFLDEDEEKPDIENSVSTDNIEGNVTFDHVKFGYNKEKIIIQDFTTNVRSGEKIAIVGPTGGGKTTIIKLLLRFYDVTDGKILIDNKNIKDFKRHELRKLFGMVLQDTWLFSGKIKDNISYGNMNADDEEIIKACRMAEADDYIESLQHKYDSIVNEENSNISQGQKQLLTIARAILSNPKILILDEATSSVDTRTEQKIQKAMDKLMEGRTSFIIAHRLSTIKNADKILVLKDGHIIEQGTHEELLKKNGFYTNLYNSQFENAVVQ